MPSRSHGYKVKISADEQGLDFAALDGFRVPQEIHVSAHFFQRVAYEFLDLSWLVAEALKPRGVHGQ